MSLSDLSKDELLQIIEQIQPLINELNDIKSQLVDFKATKIQIDNLYKSYFIGEENNIPITEQIEKLKADASNANEDIQKQLNRILELEKELLNESEDTPSVRKKINVIVDQLETTQKAILQKNDNLTQAYNQILVDSENGPSIKTQLITTNDEFAKALSLSQAQLKELTAFYKSVFTRDIDANGNEVEGLKTTVFQLKNQLEGLINESTAKLQALTDQALHNSFAKRAASHSEEYKDLQQRTLYSIYGILAVTITFGTIQLINTIVCSNPFDYHLTYYQLGLSLPLIFIAWMYNRNQKIAKKLAEEYHHKAALSEAMTGYRNLYGLKHDSAEYLSLFDKIKDQLNVNPSNKIDKFLSLKSPQEKIIEKGASLLEKPEDLEELIKKLIREAK